MTSIPAEQEAQAQLGLVESIAFRAFIFIILVITAYSLSPFFDAGLGGTDSERYFLTH